MNYPNAKKNYTSLIVAVLLMAGFAVIFYINMLNNEKGSNEVIGDLKPSVEKLIIEEVEKNGKQLKTETPKSNDTEHFTFYKTLTSVLKKPAFDPVSELTKEKNNLKMSSDNLNPRSEKRTQGSKIQEEVSKGLREGVYSVQISSFADFERAEGFLKIMKRKGLNAFIVASNSKPDQTLFRVCLGKFKNFNEAASESKKLNGTENLRSIVIKE